MRHYTDTVIIRTLIIMTHPDRLGLGLGLGFIIIIIIIMHGHTALHSAADDGHTTTVKLLLDRGALLISK